MPLYQLFSLIRQLRSPAAFAGLAMSLTLASTSAWAGQAEAEAAVGKADAKLELVTRTAGLAGANGDQTFNMARQRLDAAHGALKGDHYDTAGMLADEAAVLAELTAERASLAALQTSHDAVAKTVATPTPAL